MAYDKMLSLIRKKRKRQKRAKPGTGLKTRLRQRVEEQVQRGISRQAIYDELMQKSRAALNDPGSPTSHLDANAYVSVADEVLHVMLDRNHQAARCEKEGRIAQAIALYEANSSISETLAILWKTRRFTKRRAPMSWPCWTLRRP